MPRVERGVGWIAIGILAALVAAPVASGGPEPAPERPPTVDEVLGKIDGALFFHDRQEGLAGYEARLAKAQSTLLGRMEAPEPESGEKDGRVLCDVRKGKQQTDASGKAVPPGSFTPFCGPWTLTELMAFEIELFAIPLRERFVESRWTRAVERRDGGLRLTLVPKVRLRKGAPLDPSITKIVLDLDAAGVPTGAVLDLDQGPIRSQGTLRFAFEDHAGRKRIVRIENRLPSANFEVRPTVTFDYVEVKGFALPARVRVEVAGTDLSPSMRGMTLFSYRFFEKYAVRKTR